MSKLQMSVVIIAVKLQPTRYSFGYSVFMLKLFTAIEKILLVVKVRVQAWRKYLQLLTWDKVTRRLIKAIIVTTAVILH